MGATSTTKPSHLSSRQFLKDTVKFTDGYTILDVATVGSTTKEAYFLTRHPDGFVTVYACTYTTGAAYPGDPDNFGWRDPWGEQHGIHEIRCPERFLRRLSPLPDAPDPAGVECTQRAIERWETNYRARVITLNERRATLEALSPTDPGFDAATRAVFEVERDVPARSELHALRDELRAADPFAPHREWRAKAWAAATRAKAFLPGATLRFTNRLSAGGTPFDTVTLLTRKARQVLAQTDGGVHITLPLDAQYWPFEVITPAPPTRTL
ncbi:hypothetical protein [Deinococcus soli (ex Cha et al. 2016)]|uniref:Uncharacterized protein n=2 Tax=Deinococcus soli (ex Cha et al. 2016) TaxID=1309411 RepID=A0AAE3XBN9_9DEIO|nr:hypothetical protein [Deinococcus soli (ex Cha et al. 2016)]MDR6218835.1 hypothetical protein [Deinococcus soli (ex Cha et al. 2016)]MDR6328632.1 hypothetical protein [Deinococcus soli (ex Cha et al. 2016)]MDR6751881.1 hypothetical protein [Deinococcus soli (ex Cha et al. 2016)]